MFNEFKEGCSCSRLRPPIIGQVTASCWPPRLSPGNWMDILGLRQRAEVFRNIIDPVFAVATGNILNWSQSVLNRAVCDDRIFRLASRRQQRISRNAQIFFQRQRQDFDSTCRFTSEYIGWMTSKRGHSRRLRSQARLRSARLNSCSPPNTELSRRKRVFQGHATFLPRVRMDPAVHK